MKNTQCKLLEMTVSEGIKKVKPNHHTAPLHVMLTVPNLSLNLFSGSYQGYVTVLVYR